MMGSHGEETGLQGALWTMDGDKGPEHIKAAADIRICVHMWAVTLALPRNKGGWGWAEGLVPSRAVGDLGQEENANWLYLWLQANQALWDYRWITTNICDGGEVLKI